MKLKIVLFCIAGLMASLVYGQEETASASRKANIKHMLDYRYRGGFYSFEKLFNQTVTYPKVAAGNCVTGIVVVAFEVNCEGEVKNVRMKTPLYYGIREEITKFFDATEGLWNTCDDERYTRFEIPIQFRIIGVETNMEDGILICETNNEGYMCNGDAYYLKKAEKYLKKGNRKKALKNINILIQRNPYNTEYYDMRKKALGESDPE